MSFFRKENRTLQQAAWVLSLRLSTLSEWNHGFDDTMKPVVLPDGRGKAIKVTVDMVRRIVAAAENLKAKGRRLRLTSFTRDLATGHKIVLSSKIVKKILVANDIYRAGIKRRRPQFYQTMGQAIPNGLVSVDGSEFCVLIDHVPYKFNLELSVDVKSFLHSAFSVSDTETSEEFIRVMEAHRAIWGPPLAIVGDHGKANLSYDSKAYLERNNIEILPAGPGNPKGNGTVESAFSDMKEVIGTVSLETSSPRALAKGVLEKVVSVFIAMRNRVPRSGDTKTPQEAMNEPVSEKERQHHRKRYKERKRKTDDPGMRAKLDHLDWVVTHHGLEVDEQSLKRAQKCIVSYDLEAITKSEEAFLKALRRNQQRRTLAYFFGILRHIQDDMDASKYRDYCFQRYNYRQMVDRERERREKIDYVTTLEDLVAVLQNAVLSHVRFLKEASVRQAERMADNLKKHYRYMGVLKRKISDALGAVEGLSLSQRQEAWGLVEQFIN